MADMVAYEHLKTPTALADWFVDVFAQEDFRVQNLAGRLSLAVRTKGGVQAALLEKMTSRIRSAVSLSLAEQRRKVELLEYRVATLNPAAILAKGFTLTLRNGRRITSSAQLESGDILTTVFPDGNVKSEIQ